MKINYLFIALVVMAIYFYYSHKNGKKVKGYSLSEVILYETIFALMCAAPICIIFWIFSSTVYEIRDDYKYKKNDYILFYRNIDKKFYLVVPFTNYLSNESSRVVEYKSINYVKITPGQTKGQEYWEYIARKQPDKILKTFQKGEFKRIASKPDYILEELPKYSSNSYERVVDYK